MDKLSKIKYLRSGGNVKRAHTFPHIGEYSVGLHTYNMLILLTILKPDYSKELMEAILFHDGHEVITGDIPSFSRNLEFKTYEIETQKKLGTYIELNDEDSRWLVGLDKLELHMWCTDQLYMGNNMVNLVIKDLYKWFEDGLNTIPTEIQDIYWSYKSDPLSRKIPSKKPDIEPMSSKEFLKSNFPYPPEPDL